MNRISLRTRLVAVAVTLVAVAVVATGIATYAALSGFLHARLDDEVVDAAQRRAPLCLQEDDFGGGFGFYAQPLTPTGLPAECTSGTQAGNPLDLDTAAIGQVLAGPGQLHSIRAVDGAPYRAMLAPRREGLAVVALPTGPVDSTLSRLLGLELIVGGAAVVATGVLGAAGVRLGLRPLDRVTRTARTVAAELGPDGSGLDRRVPEADPHTEVGQLAGAVNTMLDAVEREYGARYESEQRMRRFLADASHELRTPLTSLRGYAELVRLRGGLDEAAGDSLRRIESEGTRMGRLVEDLLTLARADQGTLAERAPVDVAGVVADTVAGLRAAFPDRPVSMHAAGPLPVLGDRDQLIQVVGNVLTNAAVHADGAIDVSAGRQDGEVVVRVADGGPGLPPDQAAQVFDRFWRADAARTRARGGSGLGLSIVQALVTEHGGQVAFESDPAGGSTVTVRLPAAP
jgi:two-component system, OmpR family, sensor kinase